MSDKGSIDSEVTRKNLRRIAEKRFAEQPVHPDDVGRSPEEIIYELHVHQIELEMQNEALRDMQEALEVSREKFIDLYEFAPVGYLTLTKKAIIEEGNLTCASILEVERELLLKSRFSKFIVHEDLEIWSRYLIRVCSTTNKQVCELRLRKGDDSVIHVRLESICNQQGHDGTHIRMAVSDITESVQTKEKLALKSHDLDELQDAYRTITAGKEKLLQNEMILKRTLGEKEALLAEVSHRLHEQKKTEDALQESELQYRILFTGMQEGFYLAEMIYENDEPVDFRYLDVNPAFEKLMGKTRDQLIGKTAKEAIPAIKPSWARVLGQVLLTGEPIRYDEYSEVFGRHFEAFIFRPQEGEVAVLVTDITERKNAEDELKQKNEDLNRALIEKEVLLSEIHHRVKNNLTAFISLLSLEGAYEETASGLELKKNLQNRARSMALIHETLYRTGQYSVVDMEVYMSTLIDHIVDSYNPAHSVITVVEAKGVMLDLARATAIGLIMTELVTNSLKYAFPRDTIMDQDQSTVVIRLTKESDEYLLMVSDNGIGLPAMFDIKTTNTLGLKLVNILAKHQLRATVEVIIDNGTKFVLRFREKE